MKKIFLLYAILLTFSCTAQPNVQNVDSETFKKHIEQNNGVLIDLRTDEEIDRKGLIKGAVQIDYFSKNAEAEIAKLDRNKTYLIYCAGGGRSGECAELMTKLGFTKIINLEKGYDDWKKKNFETQMRTKKE